MSEISTFSQKVHEILKTELTSEGMDILQINVGLLCNQQCSHCHVSASPNREEIMTWEIMEQVLDIVHQVKPKSVDITGGAPELNPHFRKFVLALRNEDVLVQVRTNLSVIFEPGQEDLPDFYHLNQIQLVGSMPCYLEENVDAQRGIGVYKKSIEAIKQLNQRGYGVDPDKVLNLVYNPGGPFLPPDQKTLEVDYKRELKQKWNIVFTNLLTLTNMPIGKYLTVLKNKQQDAAYWSLLKDAFNPETLKGLMCRHQLSIGWDGTFYDCDFNLALGMPVNHGAPDHINKFDHQALLYREIVIADHCFGCTAGCGSSCGGALTE